jgi:ABC-2 type transport system ATP-binding protein
MTTQPVPAIRVQGLEKSYQKLRVLRGVDFDVARGSISPCSAPTAQARPRP